MDIRNIGKMFEMSWDITERQGEVLDNVNSDVMKYCIKKGIHMNKGEVENEFEIYEQVIGQYLEELSNSRWDTI